ncbi:MAG: hypothetical protein COB15_17460 [Flavobacteriales bacterium]|nr:MAG: hypothetical protein COB15_17460 [Flavobacteriales bacterium]
MLWGNAADIGKIFVLQKRAIRFIYGLKPRDSLRELFKSINIMTVASQYIFDVLIFVKSNLHLYKTLSDVNSVVTRNRHKLCMNRFRLKKVRRSFVGQSVKLFNKLPVEAINLPMPKFKSYIKNALMANAYYTISDYLNDKKPWTLPKTSTSHT